jgi:hypothetical protein
MHEDLRSLISDLSRREFVVTSLAAGLALAVRPVSGDTVTTDAKGLEAGEVKIPVKYEDKEGEMPAYRAMPEKGGPFPVVLVVEEIFGGPTSTSRMSAGASPSSVTWPSHRSYSPGKATCRMSPRSRASFRLFRKLPMPRSSRTSMRRSRGPRRAARSIRRSWASQASAGAAASSGCTRRTIKM